MMMPANFSAISENEMTYVAGGALIDCLAPVMTDANWKTFSTNLVTVIGNKYVEAFLKNTVGTIFSGAYVPGQVFGNVTRAIGGAYNAGAGAVKEGTNKYLAGANGVLNAALQITAGLAAIYNLGNAQVKNYAKDLKYSV